MPAGDLQFEPTEFLNKYLEDRCAIDFPKSDHYSFYNMFYFNGLHSDKVEKRRK